MAAVAGVDIVDIGIDPSQCGVVFVRKLSGKFGVGCAGKFIRQPAKAFAGKACCRESAEPGKEKLIIEYLSELLMRES